MSHIIRQARIGADDGVELANLNGRPGFAERGSANPVAVELGNRPHFRQIGVEIQLSLRPVGEYEKQPAMQAHEAVQKFLFVREVCEYADGRYHRERLLRQFEGSVEVGDPGIGVLLDAIDRRIIDGGGKISPEGLGPGAEVAYDISGSDEVSGDLRAVLPRYRWLAARGDAPA